MINNKKLVIGWLYPDFMNTYGDSGNIIIFKDRCEERGINVQIKKISLKSDPSDIIKSDFLFMGGAQDKQQEIIYRDLLRKKYFLKLAIEKKVPGLFICGAFQLLGNYYITAEGVLIKGLGILDFYTENPGKKRLVGNIISGACIKGLKDKKIIGFENHGGQTYLNAGTVPFGKVIKGYGNNEKDLEEGAFYKNTIGTYLHGPIFSKNPQLADWFIERALKIKYGEDCKLKPMNDGLELSARDHLIN